VGLKGTEDVFYICTFELIWACYWWFNSYGQNGVRTQKGKAQGHGQRKWSKRQASTTDSHALLFNYIM